MKISSLKGFAVVVNKIIVSRKEVGHEAVLGVTENTWKIYIRNQ